MGTIVTTFEIANNYLLMASGTAEPVLNRILNWPGTSLVLFAVLFLALLRTTFVHSRKLRELSEAVERQSSDIASMRQTLEDAMGLMYTVKSSSYGNFGGGLSGDQDTALREELESLRAEILSDAEPEIFRTKN
jgi:hypothetical protein